MSLNTKGVKCVACSAYLFEEDDVVYCPICGAPHHRDCYSALGRCALEELHGTENQYTKTEEAEEPKETISEDNTSSSGEEHLCATCGHPLSDADRFCPRCGRPSAGEAFGGFSPFTSVVEIKDETPVAEGVTAIEAAKIVKVNAFRYIPKFLQMEGGKKVSWNWGAFIFHGAWFAYRKMYKESFITTAIMIMSMLLNIPFNLAIATLPTPGEKITTYLQMGEYYAGYLSEIGVVPLVLAVIGMVVGVALRIICGVYGDHFYKGRVARSALLLREAEDGIAAEKKYSGVSFIGFLIALAAVEFLPGIIATFFI